MTILSALTVAIILNGIITGIWGLFHQLTVGGAISLFRDPDEKEARIILMAWVSQGALLSLAGFLPAILMIFHGPQDPGAHTTFLVVGVALALLSAHVGFTGLRYPLTPVRIGWVLQTIQAFLLLTAYAAYR